MTTILETRRPVKTARVLFDATEPHAAPPTFAAGLADGPTPADMRAVDAARDDAYADAIAAGLDEAEAEEHAGVVAANTFARLAARRHADRWAPRDPSPRYLEHAAEEDRAWWARESNRHATDYVVVGRSTELAAGAALAQARMDAGYAIL